MTPVLKEATQPKALATPAGSAVGGGEPAVVAPSVMPPPITDQETRRGVLAQLVAQMQANPMPAAAPQWTREQLHERG